MEKEEKRLTDEHNIVCILYRFLSGTPQAMILLVLTLLQRRIRPNKCGYYRPGFVV